MDAPRLAMIPSQRQPKELVPRRDNRIRCWRISGPGRLQSVKQALQHSPAFPKISPILFRKKKAFAYRDKENFPMRLGQAIFFGAAAALLTLAAPTLARNSSANPPPAKATEAPTAAICHAYQQTADGAWTQLPCQETPSRASAQPHSSGNSATATS